MVSYYLYINPDSTAICDLVLFVTGYDGLYGFSRYGFSRPQQQGYVVTTLQAGLYHGLAAATATEAIVEAVMIGVILIHSVQSLGLVLELNHFLING